MAQRTANTSGTRTADLTAGARAFDWDPGSWNPSSPTLPEPGEFLQSIQDIYARNGNTPQLRELVQAMLDWYNARDTAWHLTHDATNPDLGKWLSFHLARLHLMARDYRSAYAAWSPAFDFAPMRPIWARLYPKCLRTITSPPALMASPQARSNGRRLPPSFVGSNSLGDPQLMFPATPNVDESYPENYYTFHYSLTGSEFAYSMAEQPTPAFMVETLAQRRILSQAQSSQSRRF